MGVGWPSEMAIQLQKQGHEVALLAIIDTNAPIISNKPVGLDWDDARWLTEFAKTLESVHGKNLEVSYAALQSLDPDEQFKYLLKRLQMEDILPLGLDFGQFRSLVQVFKANCQVNYVSQEVYPNRITLFRASEAVSEEAASMIPV